MGKNVAPNELIILYFLGVKPKQMISKGYAEPTVYAYKNKYELAKANILKLFGFQLIETPVAKKRKRKHIGYLKRKVRK